MQNKSLLLLEGSTGCRPMLTSQRRETLGAMYSLVGSHSAVKLCRWQKSMLRCRGGCYKWTMYGIASHRCMEATPNLSCANNCVFCWRLNSNPTATSWRWLEDKPEDIVEGMISTHRELIQNVRGMPGVSSEKLAEAFDPCHCALSLVGEPIMYPQVNSFLQLLHKKRISTFLVTNGQFPDAIPRLTGVTQLYLSIDAPNSHVMKLLDRPAFPDFWDRFQQSVKHMGNRRERTVFRLTLIDGYNMSDEDIKEYVALIELGKPDFIELKRLTPAFQGHASKLLRMKNVPSWEGVKEFSKKLSASTGSQYVLSSLHEHSGCVLLSKASFHVGSEIFTWIDFHKFHELVQKDPSTVPTPEMYWQRTPEWALPQSPEEGFDPAQTRHVTTKRAKHIQRESQSESTTTLKS